MAKRMPPPKPVTEEKPPIEAPPPPQPDPVAVIRGRLQYLVEVRNNKARELQAMVKSELAPLDTAINELNAVLTAMNLPQHQVTVANIEGGGNGSAPQSHPTSSAPMGSAANLRDIAQQHPLSGQNLLRRKMGGGS